MIKNWKNLFIKDETEGSSSAQPNVSFPKIDANPVSTSSPSLPLDGGVSGSPDVAEVMEVYDNGLASINMPGYDFYEYYMAVNAAGFNSEQAYNMAFKMAKDMDSTLTVQKLVNDAEFYISKINEVHSQYVGQGQQRLTQLNEKRTSQKNEMTKSLEQANIRLTQLKNEIQQLENEIRQKNTSLSGIDAQFEPQELVIKHKLAANDFARNTSISKLTLVRDHILKFVKNS